MDGTGPHVTARVVILDDECPMCGWTVGTNPTSCGECAENSIHAPDCDLDDDCTCGAS